MVKLIDGPRYICCFTCIAKDFEEEKARLEIERTTVKRRVDVAKRRGDDVQANALFWEKEADKLIQEDIKTKQKCLFGFCPHIIWRYKRGKELTNKKEQIRRLIQTGKELPIGLPARLPDVERYSSQHYIPFKSRESKYKELLDALKDDNNYITGLQGMGGTGKTTLAKEVGKALKESKQFTQIIDTTVSFSPDIRKIQDYMAGPLGLKFDECSESDRPRKLWKRLTNGEKILLILDNVWGDINFDEIGIPDSDYHKGCRILVTTRNLSVCNILGCSKIIQLDLLSEEEAWIMFQRHAGLSEISNESLLDKGHKISNECRGLPIAIAYFARSLMGEQRPEEWDMTLKTLQKNISLNGFVVEIFEVYKCLIFSYDNMKNVKARILFLLCSIFQEDEEIPIERITRLGIGGGLFGEDYGSYEDARIQVVVSKNILLDYCLLLEVDQSRVKMHGLVRDAAQWRANYDIQTVKLYDKNQKAMVERKTNIKYLLCEGKLEDVFSFKLDGSELEILIVSVNNDQDCHNMKIEVPNSFFENSTGLRVFHLIYDHYRKITLSLPLPQSIQSLKNIRSLLITLVDLGDISTLGNLQSLETLDLTDCKIDELPHGIAELEKFRLLNLECCIIVRNNPFEVIERCSLLEELYFTGSFNASCREITFPKLQRFCIDEKRRSVNDSSSKYVSVVEKGELFLSESTLKYCMQTTEVLRLRRIEREWSNLIPEIVSLDQGMNDIVELSLSCMSQIQHLIDTNGIGFQVPNLLSKLVVLKLVRMENLEELFNGPISIDSMNKLEELTMECCQKLRSLSKCSLNFRNLKNMTLKSCSMLVSVFDLSTSRSLLLLESLEIIDCKILENIITCERRVEYETREEILDGDNDNKSCSSVMFPKLKIVNIQRCPKLQFILPFISDGDLLSLEVIIIKCCPKLKYIFGQHQDFKLASLKEMEIGGDSPNFIDIFPESYHSTLSSVEGSSNSISKLQPKLEPIEPSIFALESVSYCLNIWEHAQWLSRPTSYIACNIKVMTLVNVSKIKSVLILSIAPKVLWESLTIKSCDELEQIILDIGDSIGGGDVFPKLKELYVENCDKMEYIVGHIKASDDHQNHNEVTHIHFPALECLKLWGLPCLIGMCTKRYRTTFPPLRVREVDACFIVDIKPIGNFTVPSSISRHHDRTTIKVNEISVEKGPSSANAKTITSSNHSKSVEFKSGPSSIASQFPSKPYEGDSSHIEEDLSSSLLVARELEQLVSEKYLNYENFSLLTDFFVKNPSVLLKDTSLSKRYKGYAYNCLAELLKFLQTHSVSDVLGSSHSEFVELLQDWMVLKRLLDSKHIPT